MGTISILGTALGLGASAGINSWATLLVFGLVARLRPGWFPGDVAEFFASTPVLIVVGVLFAIEFVADKVPTVDHISDAIHTFIRPLAGAVVAFAAASDAVPQEWAIVAAVLAGTTAMGAHFGKSGTRMASTATTGGLGNPILSLIEDVIAVVGALLSIFLPFIALALVAMFLLATTWWLLRRRRPA